MSDFICIRAKSCEDPCRHGRPHECSTALRNCPRDGGLVRCKQITTVPITQESMDLLADNVDSITRDFEGDNAENS